MFCFQVLQSRSYVICKYCVKKLHVFACLLQSTKKGREIFAAMCKRIKVDWNIFPWNSAKSLLSRFLAVCKALNACSALLLEDRQALNLLSYSIPDVAWRAATKRFTSRPRSHHIMAESKATRAPAKAWVNMQIGVRTKSRNAIDLSNVV